MASPCRFLLSISVLADASVPPASQHSGCWGRALGFTNLLSLGNPKSHKV